MAHNTMIFLYEIFDVTIHIVLQVITFVVWNIHLKGLLTHLNVSEFHLLSYLTPPLPLLFPRTNILKGSLE